MKRHSEEMGEKSTEKPPDSIQLTSNLAAILHTICLIYPAVGHFVPAICFRNKG